MLLLLIKHHAMKTYDGMEVQLHAFLTSLKVLVSFMRRQLYAGERASSPNLTGRLVEPTAGLDVMAKRKVPPRNPDPVVQLSSNH
jgi:hypothetical protein